MEERPRPDFKRHTLPPVSRKYLWRIIFYLAMLSVIIWIALASLGKHRKADPEKIHEIHGVELEVSDSLS